jgi:hypothetical protein
MQLKEGKLTPRKPSPFPGTKPSYSFKLFVRGWEQQNLFLGGTSPYNRQGKRMFHVKGKR